MRNFAAQALLLFLAFSLGTYAHVPPLSQEERDLAYNIIEGKVLSRMESYSDLYAGFRDFIYKVTMEVSKSNTERYAPGFTFTFTYWKMAKRPAGLTGDMGQNEDRGAGLAIRAGEQIRVYTDADNELLNPNGYDMIVEEAAILWVL